MSTSKIIAVCFILLVLVCAVELATAQPQVYEVYMPIRFGGFLVPVMP